MDIDITKKLRELNSATKYPSIETYHVLGEKGRLTEQIGPFAGVGPQTPVYLTEKANGTNGRMVLLPDGDYFIGQRESLLYARGDRIKNPNLSIVGELAPVAERIVGELGYRPVHIEVLFFEVLGGTIGSAARQYSRKGTVGHRLFDHAYLSMATLDASPEQISAWRDQGGQSFLSADELEVVSQEFDLPRVPYLAVQQGADLPSTVKESYEYLRDWVGESGIVLDEQPDWSGIPEGLVIRTANRSRIAKMRYEDVHRTLGIKHPKGA